jgi:hypothetical protein
MATTTNYSWTTPDDTDLVKDGAAAIRTLGSSIDTTTKNLNPQTTTGAIAYRSATSNVNTSLALGTAGQVLQVNSGATAPEWATPVTGGTWTQVATGSLTGTSVTVSSLAASNDFLVIAAAWTHNAGATRAIRLRLNGDTGFNYYDVNLPTTANNQPYLTMGPKFNTNTIYSVWQINGANTSQVKQIVMTSSQEGGGYYDSATAISSITMFLDTGSFTAGTYYIWSR